MKRIISTLVLATLLSACGGYNEGIVQKSEKGFLKFTGHTAHILVKIDDNAPISDDGKGFLFEVKPGKHTIQVIRADEIIVKRTVLVDDQTTMEIEVP